MVLVKGTEMGMGMGMEMGMVLVILVVMVKRVDNGHEYGIYLDIAPNGCVLHVPIVVVGW